MGLYDTIIIEGQICPKCGKILSKGWQTKDFMSFMLTLFYGKKIQFKDGTLKLVAEGNAKWNIHNACEEYKGGCGSYITANLIIKKGIIKKIKNIKVKK